MNRETQGHRAVFHVPLAHPTTHENDSCWQVPVTLAIVQPVADDEFVRNIKSYIVHLHIYFAPRGLVQQSNDAQRTWIPSLKGLQKKVKREACIDDIFDQEYILSLEAFIQILENPNLTATLGLLAVAAHGNKVEGQLQIDGPYEICMKYAGAFENADQMRCFSMIVLRNPVAQFADTLQNCLTIEQHRAESPFDLHGSLLSSQQHSLMRHMAHAMTHEKTFIRQSMSNLEP
jgi:hypothetical protein